MNTRSNHNQMTVPWYGMQLFEWIGGLLADTGSGEDLPSGKYGILCVDLTGYAALGALNEHTPDGWNAWLSRICPEEKLGFADRLSGHLWIYAELRDNSVLSPQDCLSGIARAISYHLVIETNEYAKQVAENAGAAVKHEHSDQATGAVGAALLIFAAGKPLRESVYEGMIQAALQLRLLQEQHPRQELCLEMETLLREGAIRSVYQPITRLSDGQIFGYEALTRCAPGSRFDGPLALFSFAEKEGYALALDRLAREKAIRFSPEMQTHQKIFINVTMGIMNDSRFISGQTVEWLKQRGLHPGQVVFELTERSSIDDFPAAQKILGHYRSQGYEIAIDDAGAGYSSLQAIVELRPDYIKIDKSLVQLADQDEMKEEMLRTLLRYAHQMNIKTVAEGIERPEELQLVTSLGFDFGQGYLLGRPQ